MKLMVSIFTSILLLIGLVIAGYFLLKLFGTKEIFSRKQEDVSMAYSLVNACSKDDDCILSDITPYCGCHYLVNKHIGTVDLANAVSAYRGSGEVCTVQPECQEAPNSDEIKCVSGKCTSVRPTTDPAKTFSDDPDVLKEIFSRKQEDVNIAYSLVNACSKDDDCILSNITPYCGCNYLVNKHVGTVELADVVSTYRSSGEKCDVQIQCQEAPEPDKIKCVSGKCTSVRPTLDPSKSFSDDPDVLKQQINNLLLNANYCATADNCVVADVGAGCPFDCYNLVSRNADLTWIKEGVAKYHALPGADQCKYDCDRMPNEKEIRCVKNKCVDSRYQK